MPEAAYRRSFYFMELFGFTSLLGSLDLLLVTVLSRYFTDTPCLATVPGG